MLELVSALGLGLVLGTRHALEPDHLAAISTLVAERPSARRGAWLGAVWGAGHTIMLAIVGGTLVLVGAALPERVERGFEGIVALMLVVLGVRSLIMACKQGASGPLTVHSHDGVPHAHATSATHVHLRRWVLARRPLAIGLVHGLAGSGSLTAMAIAALPSTGARVGYIVLFGVGSIAGMALLSGLAGWPLARVARRPSTARALAGLTGALSAIAGVVWGLEAWGV